MPSLACSTSADGRRCRVAHGLLSLTGWLWVPQSAALRSDYDRHSDGQRGRGLRGVTLTLSGAHVRSREGVEVS